MENPLDELYPLIDEKELPKYARLFHNKEMKKGENKEIGDIAKMANGLFFLIYGLDL